MITETQMIGMSLPVIAIFGVVLWLMIFMETYRHFPKMDGQKRLEYSIINATGITLIIILICSIFLYYLYSNILQI